MSKYSRMVLLGSASAFALWIAMPAIADNAAPASETGAALEEITVNARRISENQQQVPITTQVFTEAQLKLTDTVDLFTLGAKTASVTMCCSPGQYFITFIRGIQDVVTYFDDAPVNPSGNAMFFDIEDAQVLKGPQGTLFGLASDGGAILFQPKKPDNTFGGYGTVELGSYSRSTVEGALNMPIIDDKLLLRFSMRTFRQDGYTDDLTMHRSLNNQDWQDFRISLTYRPTSTFENRTLANYYTSNSFVDGGTLTRVNPAGLGVFLLGPGLIQALATQQKLGQFQQYDLPVPFGYINSETSVKRWNFINTTNWDISDNLTLHNVASSESIQTYNQLDPLLWSINADGSLGNPAPLPHQNPPQPFNQTWTEDLSLRGKVLGNNLSYVLGGFFSGNKFPGGITYSNLFNFPSAAYAQTSSNTKAVYAQGTYNLSSVLQGLSFTGGYRYSWDTREQQTSGLDPNTLEQLNFKQGTGHFSAPSYTLVLDYQYTPNILFYFNNSKGYSSGGLQLSAPPGYQTFQPQSLNNFELGLKSEYAIGASHVRTNLAVYYGLFDNVQAAVNSLIQVSPPPAPPVETALTENGAKATIKGIDASIALASSSGFDLGIEYSYMNDKYTKYDTLDSAGNPVSYAGVRFEYVPRYKFTLTGTYHLPFATYGHFSATANYSYTPTFPARILPADVIRPDQFVEKHDNLDLSFNWDDVMNHRGLDAAVFVQNVENNTVSDYNGEFYTNLGYNVLVPAVPRQFGVRLTYHF
jgi:iron complex outermembrane recepter protein